MRWLVGWSSIAASFGTVGAVGNHGEGRTVHPVGSQLLWGDPDPLWAVGDWRPDEIRVITVATPEGAPTTRLAVLGCCGATDEQLRVGLLAARGGALRHLTAWSGSYTAVVQIGRRITVAGDLAGARPVFHTPWANGTAYATAALPLADLIEAQLDIGHLAALLACPETPEALGDGTPYAGVKRIPPGHALILREGSREITGYEAVASLAVAAPQTDPVSAVEGVRDALVDAVRARLTAPRHAPETLPPDPGPVPGMGPAERRAARGAPVPGIGADLSGGSASATLALLAAGLPGLPGTVLGHGTGAGERLLAVTFNDLSAQGREDELERARAIASNPRLHHVVVAAGEEALPYASLESGPLTDEPAPPWSSPNATAAGSPRAAPTTSSATAPARYWTPTRHGWPTSSWTGADATSCGPSPRSPGPKGLPRTPCSCRWPSTGRPAGWPVRRTAPGWRPRRPSCPRPTATPPTSTPRPTPRSPPSPGPGRVRRRAGSPGRRSRKYRFASRRRPSGPPRCSARGGQGPRGARPARGGPADPGAGRGDPKPAAARPLPRQPGRTGRPRPPGVAAGPAGRPRRDPAPGPRGRRHPRPAARLGHPVPGHLDGGRTHRPACRPPRPDRPLRRTAARRRGPDRGTRRTQGAARGLRGRAPPAGRLGRAGVHGALAPPAGHPPGHLLDRYGGPAAAGGGRRCGPGPPHAPAVGPRPQARRTLPP